MNVTIYSHKKWDEMTANDHKSSIQLRRKLKLNRLILNWMIVECHINAVISFSRDLGLDLENYITDDGSKADGDITMKDDLQNIELNPVFDNLSDEDDEFFHNNGNSGNQDEDSIMDDLMVNNLKTIKIRNEIKMSILRGEISKTFELINLKFPNLFDKNHLIYFKLLHLHLIEMIREHVIIKLSRQVDDEEERVFLERIMSFVKLKLSNLKILSNKIFIKELELTMVLLCYTDELTKLYQRNKNKVKINIPLKLRKLFDKSQRIKISKLINKSILLDINNDDDINLIKYEDDQDDQDLLLKFNQLENNKLVSLIKLWIWCENELAINGVIFPGINLDL